MARTGRRPGSEDTRGAILAAARSSFASQGFHATTIRAVAGSAGVDPALVHHYFGNKEELFAAAIDLPLRPKDVAEEILSEGIDHVGERLARLFLSVWDNPASREPLQAMLRGAFTNEQGADTLREFFESVLLERVVPAVELPDARLRVSLAASQLVGLAVLRYVVGFEALRHASVDDLVELIAPRIQSYLTG